jgi:2-polyprenyl-3-methyl-5-hydroxy-6-metoxy-1,4-benzoquinol methylase
MHRPELIAEGGVRGRKGASILTLADLFRYGGSRLIPDQPCSPYRYMEFLIEKAVQGKFAPANILEIGPGVDGAIKYLDLETPKRVLVVDFNRDVIDAVGQRYPKAEARLVDVTETTDLRDLTGQWDYVICNSVVEHVIDDQALVDRMFALLRAGGIVVCSTVLHQRMYNTWDYAVGHYRRYEVAELESLFKQFSEVQLIKTAMAQEIARPLFFGRMFHLMRNTIEQNNRLCGHEQEEWGRSPYAGIWFMLKYLMPLFLVFEWAKRNLFGGIGIIIARKPS